MVTPVNIDSEAFCSAVWCACACPLDGGESSPCLDDATHPPSSPLTAFGAAFRLSLGPVVARRPSVSLTSTLQAATAAHLLSETQHRDRHPIGVIVSTEHE